MAKRLDWWPLVGWVLLCNAVGGIGAIATASSVDTWYAQLHKPSWTPPSWLFGPVWTTLYVLMGIAAYLVWRSEHPARPTALTMFFVQLVLNGAWSPVFFGMRAVFPALIIIMAMLVAIAVTIYWFAKVSRAAAWMLAPYLAWVCYATTLNWGINALN
jgi:benzodiazapine receptor